MIALSVLLLCSLSLGITVNSTVVSGSQLTITGTGFTGTLMVLLNAQKLTIVSSTSTQIVATLNSIPIPGAYRLIVKSGTASAPFVVTVSRDSIKIVPFSASPIFDLSLGNVQKITMSGNVTSPTIINGFPGQQFTLMICADSSGDYIFYPPATLRGVSSTVNVSPNMCAVGTALVDEDGVTEFMSSAWQNGE